MVYADVADVHGRWVASAIPPDDDVIARYLEDATALIDADAKITPPVAERLGIEPGLDVRARIVCVRMVMRCLTNPDQVRSRAETDGPYSGTLTYATETLAGALAVTDDDRALLSPRKRGRVSSILPYPVNTWPDTETPRLDPKQVVNYGGGHGD
ncbi:hypothetical protein H8R18_01290 [Nanchangia anserum]|uniref:Head-to-tail adaptor n=1 Tax=Nanchangia anserum TaxID=2692125 RepID=A0A8I0KP12_9ACTO|nr:hypothetical protein [Nanchangia anserum]MBD3689871.1 hypothetical protein [Nanchangia anserum]QOX82039.1 hypothetical protein H8R18_01290 [Nanchangia anserum]